ncbi:MAG: GldG family protein [bacterium]
MKRAAEGANTGLLIGVVVLALTVLNVAAHRWFVRADLTARKEYTITPATRKVLGGLGDLVSVNVYFSGNLPPYLIAMQRRTTDLLEDMRAYAGDNMRVEVRDPASDPKLEARVRGLGIPQIQLQVIEKDKASVRNAYLGIAVQYEDRNEVIPVVRPEGLEYDIVSAILKVTRNEKKTIGFIAGGDRSFEKGFTRAKELLDREYELREITMGRGDAVPLEVSTLIVAGPAGVSERDAYEIDQFVMRGGRAIFMLDPIQAPIEVLSGMRAGAPSISGLENVLASYGLRSSNEVVFDPGSHALISYVTSIGGMQFSTTRPYPFFCKLTPQTLSPANPAVSELESMVVPWAARVELVDPLPEGVAIDTLGRSTDQAWVQAGRVTFSPQSRIEPPDPDKVKSFPLAFVASGVFRSAYAGQPAPAKSAEAMELNEMMEPAPQDTAAAGEMAIGESPATQVVLVGSSYVIDDNMLAQYPENGAFLLNMVDWLTLGDELIGIRSREVTDRPLREVSDSARTAVRVAGIFGTPLAVIAFGLIRFLARRRAKRLALSGAAA